MLTKIRGVSPVIVARLSWRYIYWITAGVGIFAWGLLVAFVPETRYFRSDAELGMYILRDYHKSTFLSLTLDSVMLISYLCSWKSSISSPTRRDTPPPRCTKIRPTHQQNRLWRLHRLRRMAPRSSRRLGDPQDDSLPQHYLDHHRQQSFHLHAGRSRPGRLRCAHRGRLEV